MFEGPVEGAAGGCEGSGGFNELEAGIRRLLPLDNDIFALIAVVGQTVQGPKGHLYGPGRKVLISCKVGGRRSAQSRGCSASKVNNEPPGHRAARATSLPSLKYHESRGANH